MGRLIVAWWLGLAAPVTLLAGEELERFEFTQVEMAVPIKIVLYCPDSATATRVAKAAFSRIHDLNAIMSDYDENSELRRLCNTSKAGAAVPVSQDLWNVLCHAKRVSEISEGAFDVTVGPVVRLWRRARRQKELPSPEKLQAALALVGHNLVRLHPERRSVELLKPGMLLDLGGIAKGYAMDEAMKVIHREGISRALVHGGGDMRLGDPPPGQTGWRIGQTSLQQPEGRPTHYLILSRVAVSTSGDDIQYVEIAGRRYSHIVDPRTGIGLTDHCRVTVVAPDGMTAEGLSKAVSVLGAERGLRLVEDTPGTAAMVLRAPQDKVERHESRRWKDLPCTPIPNP